MAKLVILVVNLKDHDALNQLTKYKHILDKHRNPENVVIVGINQGEEFIFTPEGIKVSLGDYKYYPANSNRVTDILGEVLQKFSVKKVYSKKIDKMDDVSEPMKHNGNSQLLENGKNIIQNEGKTISSDKKGENKNISDQFMNVLEINVEKHEAPENSDFFSYKKNETSIKSEPKKQNLGKWQFPDFLNPFDYSTSASKKNKYGRIQRAFLTWAGEPGKQAGIFDYITLGIPALIYVPIKKLSEYIASRNKKNDFFLKGLWIFLEILYSPLRLARYLFGGLGTTVSLLTVLPVSMIKDSGNKKPEKKIDNEKIRIGNSYKDSGDMLGSNKSLQLNFEYEDEHKIVTKIEQDDNSSQKEDTYDSKREKQPSKLTN